VKLEFAAKPMLGCVGVAAPGDSAPTSGPAGSYGGNLDYNAVGEAATVTGYGLEPSAAHMLVSFQAEYDVVTVAGTMALRIPKAVLPKP